jgi:hypothetical protein
VSIAAPARISHKVILRLFTKVLKSMILNFQIRQDLTNLSLKNNMKITKTHRCTNIMLHPPLDTVQYFPEVKNLLKKILLQRDKRDNSPESSFARKDETKPGSWRTRFIYTKIYRTK